MSKSQVFPIIKVPKNATCVSHKANLKGFFLNNAVSDLLTVVVN